MTNDRTGDRARASSQQPTLPPGHLKQFPSAAVAIWFSLIGTIVVPNEASVPLGRDLCIQNLGLCHLALFQT